MPLRKIFSWYLLVLAVAAGVTAGVAWFRHASALMDWVNAATMISLIVALLALPLLRGESPDGATWHESEESAAALSNRARGAVTLAAAASWLALAMTADLVAR